MVRHVKDKSVVEDFLTTAIDVFELVKNFFSENDINLQMIVSVCTDSAPSMLGNRSGFDALMKREIPTLQVTHCFLHRHALAPKTMPAKLKQTLRPLIQVSKQSI